jgi:hypothetical protein
MGSALTVTWCRMPVGRGEEGDEGPRSLVSHSLTSSLASSPTIGRNNVEPAGRDAEVLEQAPVPRGDRFRHISHQRNLHAPQPSLGPGDAGPGQVGLGRVGGRGDELAVERGEFRRAIVERDDLRGAHKREILMEGDVGGWQGDSRAAG